MSKVKRILLKIVYVLLGVILFSAILFWILSPGIPQERIDDDGETISYLQLPKGEYTGEDVLGFLHGQGEFLFETGEIYEGEWEFHQMSGSGKLAFEQGVYEGGFEKMKRHGAGTFVWKNGTKYTGFWENDKMNGEGEVITSTGVLYKGTFANNSLYEGTIKGKINSSAFTVEVVEGKLASEISVVFEDSVSYKGGFDGSYFSGEGTMEFPNIGKYKGNFEKGKRSAYGKFYWYDGVRYEGNWSNDVFDGEGKYYFDASTYISGDFDNGQLDGNYKYHNSDGTFDTRWEEGKCVSVELE